MPDSPQPTPPPRVEQWPDWPEYGLVEDLLPSLERWTAAGLRFALATLVEVDGSSPRPLGSEMAVCETGECVGYVSGGCVEAEVANQALAVLADGQPRLLDYGAGSPFIDIQLACGGRIAILVRTLEDGPGYVARLRAAREARQPLTLATDWDFGERRGEIQQVHVPVTRLVIAGGDPVTLSLARLAETFGLEVVLLRPNGPVNPPPGIRLRHYDRRGIETALAELQLDPWCAVYSLTHDADIDHAVLERALRSPAFCIGVLGSRRKAETRRQRLLDAGFADTQLARLHMPAGLPIGSSTPREIALAILAEIVAERAAGPQ